MRGWKKPEICASKNRELEYMATEEEEEEGIGNRGEIVARGREGGKEALASC